MGQVSFHNDKDVRRVVVEKRNGDVLRRLNKTKQERLNPDLSQEREERDKRVRDKEKAVQSARRKAERDERKMREAEAEKRSYDRLFVESKMRANTDGYDSDDFM